MTVEVAPTLGLDQLFVDGKAQVGRYVKNELEAKVAQKIFETFVRFESYNKTLEVLKESKIKDKEGNEFTLGRLIYFLRDKKLISQAERNKSNQDKNPRFLMPYDKYELVQLPHDPVIEQGLWDKAQKIMQRNSDHLRKATKLKKVYLLSGILKFTDDTTFCGTGANGNGGRKNYYYSKAHNLRLDADDIEKEAALAAHWIIENQAELKKQIIKKRKESLSLAIEVNGCEINRLSQDNRNLQKQKEQLNNTLTFLVNNAEITKAKEFLKQYESQMAEIGSKITQNDRTIENLKKAAAGPLDNGQDDFLENAENITALIEKGEPVALKAAYSKLFNSVYVVPNHDQGVIELKWCTGKTPLLDKSGLLGVTGEKGSFMKEVVGPAGLEPATR